MYLQTKRTDFSEVLRDTRSQQKIYNKTLRRCFHQTYITLDQAKCRKKIQVNSVRLVNIWEYSAFLQALAEIGAIDEEYLREKKVILHGAAHPEFFAENIEAPLQADVREALQQKGETYKLFGPEESEFGRMVLKFEQKFFPFGVVGKYVLEQSLDYNDVMKIPLMKKLMKRRNTLMAKIQSEITRNVNYFIKKREEDPNRHVFERAIVLFQAGNAEAPIYALSKGQCNELVIMPKANGSSIATPAATVTPNPSPSVSGISLQSDSDTRNFQEDALADE
ncbi:unnamed protein product [Fraxinus pennsylvanica]|uniref:Uncharacterized protein n=1 Tax=Fraxinus pennsylvanica TaxID=56036 RepID=A0AAD1ZMV3_9LAMI|nr:unnamed protein product [Fraxinus pennsylvanica]